jgi:hypothetical protein
MATQFPRAIGPPAEPAEERYLIWTELSLDLHTGERLTLLQCDGDQRGGLPTFVPEAGTKRTADCDCSSAKRIPRHIDGRRSAAVVNREALLDLAKAIEREKPTPKPGTRRKTVALLRRMFSWAVENRRKTGIGRSPFAELGRSDWARVLPKSGKRAYLYSPEQLRRLYELLLSWAARLARFGVHTGMRYEEIAATLTWRNVDLDRKLSHVEARYAKNGKARDVTLGDVTHSILEPVRPDGPTPANRVFLGRSGTPIRSIRTAFDNAGGERLEAGSTRRAETAIP